MIYRGEIYWVNYDPTIGAEIKKIRPSLIVSNNENNELAPTVTVVPLTSSVNKIFPWEIFIKKGVGGVKNDSKIKINQIRTVDKQRIMGGPMGQALSDTMMEEVAQKLKLHLALE